MLELARTPHATAIEEVHISEGGQPHLVVLQGPSFGDVYYLEDESLVLGSNPFEADIVIRDIAVEWRHARIRRGTGDGYTLEDLGTGAPAVVNGELVEGTRPLRCGDRITIGDSVLEFIERDPVKEQFHKKIQRLINHDYLTGLLAKNRFDERFEQSLEICREQGEPLGVLMADTLGVLMADIDNLKKINDSYGHLFGEFVVGEIGHIIRDCLGSEDLYATRFGGDEYQMVLPGLTKKEALTVAEKIRHNIEAYTFEQNGIFANPTLSIGVAAYPEDDETREDLTRAADEALYRAKRAGGNAVCE